MSWDFLACADLHLQDTAPACRKDKDEFLTRMLGKFRFILQTAQKHCVSVVVAGDFFNHWKPSPWLLGQVIELLRTSNTLVYVVPGQHDLPNHSHELYPRSGLHVLERAGLIKILGKRGSLIVNDVRVYGAGWEQSIPELNPDRPTAHSVLVLHRFVWQKKPFPGAPKTGNAKYVSRLKDFDLIITGDNHIPFVERHLINCGSMLRTSVAQAEHRPRVYLCRASDHKIEPVFIPIHPAAKTIDTESKSEGKVVHEEVEAFVRTLSEQDWDVGLNFRNNIKQFLDSEKVSPSVKELIWKSLNDSLS